MTSGEYKVDDMVYPSLGLPELAATGSCSSNKEALGYTGARLLDGQVACLAADRVTGTKRDNVTQHLNNAGGQSDMISEDAGYFTRLS